MSKLPEVRRADCGHGYLPVDVPPSAWEQNGHHQRDVYLCADCRAHLHRPKVETKVIRPGEGDPGPISHSAVLSPVPSATATEAWELGRRAAHHGETEDDNPYPDKRTREAKEWLRGFRETKGG